MPRFNRSASGRASDRTKERLWESTRLRANPWYTLPETIGGVTEMRCAAGIVRQHAGQISCPSAEQPTHRRAKTRSATAVNTRTVCGQATRSPSTRARLWMSVGVGNGHTRGPGDPTARIQLEDHTVGVDRQTR